MSFTRQLHRLSTRIAERISVKTSIYGIVVVVVMWQEQTVRTRTCRLTVTRRVLSKSKY